MRKINPFLLKVTVVGLVITHNWTQPTDTVRSSVLIPISFLSSLKGSPLVHRTGQSVVKTCIFWSRTQPGPRYWKGCSFLTSVISPFFNLPGERSGSHIYKEGLRPSVHLFFPLGVKLTHQQRQRVGGRIYLLFVWYWLSHGISLPNLSSLVCKLGRKHGWPLYLFPLPTVTDRHKFSGLKLHKWPGLHFWCKRSKRRLLRLK